MKTETKHTPGPWILLDNQVQIASQSAIIAEVPTHSRMDHANARLIAAAPELLDALQECLIALHHVNETDLRPAHQCSVTCAMESAQQAIAKAEGRE